MDYFNLHINLQLEEVESNLSMEENTIESNSTEKNSEQIDNLVSESNREAIQNSLVIE